MFEDVEYYYELLLQVESDRDRVKRDDCGVRVRLCWNYGIWSSEKDVQRVEAKERNGRL